MSTYYDFGLTFGVSVQQKRTFVSVKWFDSSSQLLTSQITEVSYDGGSTWVAMILTGSGAYSDDFSTQVGFHNIIIRENGGKEYDLGTYEIKSNLAACKGVGNQFLANIIRQTNLPEEFPLSLITTNGSALTKLDHSIDGGATVKDMLGVAGWRSDWTALELAAVDPLTLGIAFITNLSGDPPCTQEHSLNYVFPDAIIPLVAQHIFSNPTSDGASDGTIDVAVFEGSGNFTYLWNDGATTQDRTGLVEGVYSLVITDVDTLDTFDLEVTLVDPVTALTTFPDTFIDSSPINPIRFKDVLIGSDLPMDNYNYCEQPFASMGTPPNYERFNVQDQTALQFRSDFHVNTVELENILTGAISALSLNLAIDNLSGGQSFAATISDNGLFEGNSSIRVNNQGEINYPNPVVGGTITILDSVDYNGSYAIVDVSADESYIVLAVAFTISEAATIKFLPSDRFNVYELPVIFSDWGIGEYKITIRAVDNEVSTDKLISENIKIEAQTPNTLLITYSNVDTSYKVSWDTGIVMRKRHSGIFIKSLPARDASNFRNSNDNPAILNAYVRNKEEYNLFDLPWFAIQRLALIYSCDSLFINNKKMFVEELPETEQPDRYMLGKQTVIAEEIGWLDDQNTHDIGDSTTSIVIGGEQEEVLGI